MNDWLSLGLGSIGGALVSEVLKLLIEEAKKVKDFKPLSKDLASTMERLIPLTKEIDSIQYKLDFSVGELKELRDTIFKAKQVVHKCRGGVPWWKKANLTREIVGINNVMLKFCQTDLQLIMHRNQLTLLVVQENLVDSVDALSKRINHLSVPAPPLFMDLCSVPKLNMDPVGLDGPLMELKEKLLNDSVNSLVVSAPPGCGKTTLVTQLCHDEAIESIMHCLKVSIFTPEFFFSCFSRSFYCRRIQEYFL